MDIQDLLIFSRIAAVQNLSAVGAELGLTPGTISKRIQSLEDELSVRLFDRTTRSIRITDEGRQFLAHAEKILSELDHARSIMAESSGKPVGKLRISAPHIIGSLYLAPAIAQFQTIYPDIEIQLDISDRTVNLHEEGYDIAIRGGILTDSALIAKRLCHDHVVVAASSDYLAKYGAPTVLEDLSCHNCLVLGDLSTWTFVRKNQDVSVRVSGRFRSDNSESLRAAAISGLGIIRSTELKLSDDFRDSRLVNLMSQQIDVTDNALHALYVGGRMILPRHRVFIDYIAHWFKTHRRLPESAISAVG